MKLNFTFLFLLFLTTVFGQKTVNDSIELIKFNKYYSVQLKNQLPELLNTKEDFYFRLSYHGTKIDIWKDSTNTINGILTKFIFSEELKTKKEDTIFVKYPIEKANEIYSLINELKILDIPLEKEIKNWSKGNDGITYTFEFANKTNYQIKSYWTPKAQDSTIIEAKKLIDFCDKIKYLVKYDSINKQFENELLPGFKYNNGSIWAMYKPKITNSYIYIDFKSNYRLPLGFTFGYTVNKIKKKNYNISARFTIQNDLKDNLHLENTIWKSKIFGNNKTYFDSFAMSYQYSKLDYIKTVSKFENYTINYYGTFDNYFSFGLGFNQLKAKNTFNGINFELSKIFESIHLQPYYIVDIFENGITNYKTGINKSFSIKTRNKRFRITTSLYYEKTFDFKSLNVSINIPLKFWGIN